MFRTGFKDTDLRILKLDQRREIGRELSGWTEHSGVCVLTREAEIRQFPDLASQLAWPRAKFRTNKRPCLKEKR